MKEEKKYVYVILLPVVFAISACLFLYVGKYCEWHGFGVDTSGSVYVGRSNTIVVYSHGGAVSSIELPRFRTYYFTLQPDDTIILSDSSNVYCFDRTGTEIYCHRDERSSKYRELKNQKSIVTYNGKRYELDESWQGNKIRDEKGIVVYQPPIWDVVAKIGFYVGVVILVLLILSLNLAV